MVFDRCCEKKGTRGPRDEIYSLRFNYEFLEDFVYERQNLIPQFWKKEKREEMKKKNETLIV